MTSSTVGKDGRATLVTKQSSDVTDSLIPSDPELYALVRYLERLSTSQKRVGDVMRDIVRPEYILIEHRDLITATLSKMLSADGGESLSTSSLNTSSLPQITSIVARVKELETALKWALPLAELALDQHRMERIRCGLTMPYTKANGERWIGLYQEEWDKVEQVRSALSQGSPEL